MSQEGPDPGRVAAPDRERERAARLLGRLRDLARARRGPAHDVAAQRRVHWLSELPGDVYVETDAGPGDVLFSLPVIPLTPPAVLEEFDGWLALRHWYRLLRDLAEDEGDDEIVLGAGLLSWRPAHGPPVHDHLLGTPVRIAVDERTERVDVVLTGPATLRDGELLDGRPGFRGAERVSDAVRNGRGCGLHASAGEVLRKWCDGALAGAVDFREDWTPEAGGHVPRVRLAPALVVRPPGREAVVRYHARMIELLAEGVPDGVARFVAPDRAPQLMHIPERTPATVPDLLEGLLVRGRRVLVATSGGSAAAALHAALPSGLAALTATDQAGARAAGEALAAPAGDVDALAARVDAAEQEVAELRDRLGDGDVADLGAGYQGVRRELDERLRAEASELSWMPVRAGLPPDPPISARQAADLAALLAGETPRRRARPRQRDVDPGALPSVAYVRTLIGAERAAAERADRSQTDLSRHLRDADVTLVARLDGAAAAVGTALHDLGMDGHPGGWNPADLAVRAFADALATRRPTVWARVAEMASRAEWSERALAGMAGRRVELPSGELHLRRLASVAQELRTYLADGGTLKRGPLRSQPQRQAEVLLQHVTVDGAPPTTPELLDLVFTDLMVRMTCQELQYVWEAAGISFPADPPLADRVDRFVRAHARLARLHEIVPAVDETRELLAGLGIPLNHPLQWHGYVTALRSALEGLGVDRAAADLDALRDSIGPGGDDAPPELDAALASIDARDADAYGHALAALAEARHERALQLRCDDLLQRVRAVHPDLADVLATADVRRWDDAWAWARASAEPAESNLSPAEQRLHEAIAQAETSLTEARAELAAARARTAARGDTAPAWILPLWRIPEVLPPDADSFDAVIVDGEHGAGAEALFVLWLAPRTILVGVPGPELPPPDGPGPATPAPEGLEDVLTPTVPLFTILTGIPPEAPAPPEEHPNPTTDPGTPPAPDFEAAPDTGSDTAPDPATGFGRAAVPGPVRDAASAPGGAAVSGPARDAASAPGGAAVPGPVRDAASAPGGAAVPGPVRDAASAPGGAAVPGPVRDAASAPGGAAVPGPVRDAASAPGRAAVPGPVRDAAPDAASAPGRAAVPGPARDAASAPGRAAAPRPVRDADPVHDTGSDPARAFGDRLVAPVAPEADARGGARTLRAAPSGSGTDTAPVSGEPAEPGSARTFGDRSGTSTVPADDARGRGVAFGADTAPGADAAAGSGREPRSADARGRGAAPGAGAERQEDVRPVRDASGVGESGRTGESPGAGPRRARGPGAAGAVVGGGPRVRRGRSIATYRRPELLEIIRHVAAREPELRDEQLIDLVARLLGCPEDEALLVGARLRYAVAAFREEGDEVE